MTVTGRFQSNNSEAIRVGLLSGMGFAVVPTWLVGDEIANGTLRPVLTGWEPPTGAISAAYPVPPEPSPPGRGP